MTISSSVRLGPGLRMWRLVGLLLLASAGWASAAWAAGPLELIAVHARRLQDFERGAVACQVFGEVKNAGQRPVTAFILSVEFLDKDGRVVHKENLTLQPRIPRPGHAVGDLRPLRPGEFGEVAAEPSACPAQWLEGRIRYHLDRVAFGE